VSEIVNVGVCTVDAIARVVDEYPPKGGLRFFDQLTVTTGGNAVNCSIALAKMGIPCDLIIKVGDDMLGRFLLQEVARYGINADGIIVDRTGTNTPFTFVCVHADGQRSFIHTMGTNATLRLEEIDLQKMKNARFCFVTGTMVMPSLDGEPTARLLEEAQSAGVTTLLDTIYTDASDKWAEMIEPALPHLDYFIPSHPEATAITGTEDPEKAAEHLRAKGCRNVVIKLGEAGAFWLDERGNRGYRPAYKVDRVVDTTGAGDCWSAGFIVGLLRSEPIERAIDLGNAAAAFCIQQPGASTGIRPLKEILEFRDTAPRATGSQ